MITRIPLTKARVNLGSVVKRVHLKGEYFILEKDGIPVAGLLSVDELEDYLELRDSKASKHIVQSKKDYNAGRTEDAWDLLGKLKKVSSKKKITKSSRTV